VSRDRRRSPGFTACNVTSDRRDSTQGISSAWRAVPSYTGFSGSRRGHGARADRAIGVSCLESIASIHHREGLIMNKRQLLAFAVIAAMLAACGGSDDSFDDRADIADPKVRLVHAAPGAPNVSLFRDNQAQAADVTDMAYKSASNYFDTDRGTHVWDVRTATNPALPVGSQTFETHTGNKYTLIALLNTGSVTELMLIADPYNKSVTSDDARIRVFNAAFNTPNVDVYLTAATTNIGTVGPNLSDAGYKQAVPASGADSIDLEGGNYVLRLTIAGTKTVVFTAPVTLPEDADWLLVPVPASVTPGDMRVLVVQSDMGAPATELINQP